MTESETPWCNIHRIACECSGCGGEKAAFHARNLPFRGDIFPIASLTVNDVAVTSLADIAQLDDDSRRLISSANLHAASNATTCSHTKGNFGENAWLRKWSCSGVAPRAVHSRVRARRTARCTNHGRLLCRLPPRGSPMVLCFVACFDAAQLPHDSSGNPVNLSTSLSPADVRCDETPRRGIFGVQDLAGAPMPATHPSRLSPKSGRDSSCRSSWRLAPRFLFPFKGLGLTVPSC